MPAADPAAAAAAWLGRLPAAQRLAASAHTDARLTAWLAGGVLTLAVCVLVSRLDGLGRLRRRVERDGPKPWLAGAVTAAAFALAVLAIRAPFDAITAWWEDQVLQAGGGVAAGPSLSQQLAQAGAGILPAMGLSILFVPMLQWLIRRRPRTWPWIAGGLLGLAIFAAGWGPYALSAGPAASPLPPGPARAALLRLIADARIPARQVYVAADPGFMVDVTGGFGQAKVVVGPRLLAAPLPEVTALTGHLMGHFAHGDVLAVYLIEAALTVLGFVAMRRLFRPAARLLGAGTAGPADPEGLPALAALALVAMAVAAPISAGYLRWANVRADAFSLDHARAPDGLAAALERDWNHESVDPSPVERAIFYTHPPLKSRLEQAMAWKAAHRN